MATVVNTCDKILQAASTRTTVLANDLDAFLSPPAITLAADSAGVVASFALATGSFKLYDAGIDRTGSVLVSYSVVSSTGCTAAVDGNGAYSVSAMSADGASATLRAVYGGITLDRVLTLAKSKTGATGPNGTNSAPVQVYQRTATAAAPALPSAACTYTFATGALTGLNNGWSQAVPPATSDKPYLQITLAVAAGTGATDSIAASEWSAAQIVAVNGLDGTFSPKGPWEFRNTLDGWTFANVGTPTQNADSITVAANAADPQMISPTISLNGALYDRVRARVRRTAGSSWQGELYYATAGAGGHGYSEIYAKTISVDPTIGGAWVNLEWDMSGIADWKASTITNLRLDLGTASGDAFEVDWITPGKLGPVAIGDLGYSGDLNATRGAPSGTSVGSTPATTVESNAANGQTAYTNQQASFSLTTVSNTVGGNYANGTTALGGITLSPNNANGAVNYSWVITKTDGVGNFQLSTYTGNAVNVSCTAPGTNQSATLAISCTANDAIGKTTTKNFNANIQWGTGA